MILYSEDDIKPDRLAEIKEQFANAGECQVTNQQQHLKFCFDPPPEHQLDGEPTGPGFILWCHIHGKNILMNLSVKLEFHHLQDSEQYSPNVFLDLTQAGRVPRVFYDKVLSEHRFLVVVRFQKQVRELSVLFPRTTQLNSWRAPLE